MILVLDNYDSFTYNLVQLLTGAGARVTVHRNDALSVDELLAADPAGIVVSPGPGRPEDAGVSVALFRRTPEVPILGVCLGHQALGLAHGGRISRSPAVMHGKTSLVRHTGDGVFAGLPSPFEATRYHSLEVAGTLPEALLPIAWSDDGRLMGMRHRTLPHWGVQFHPESVLTDLGPHLIENFLRLCGSAPEIDGAARRVAGETGEKA